MGDIAFVTIEVLLVTLIIERLLHHREKQSKMQKLNMVIGAFYSEVGSSLLKCFCDSDSGSDELREALSFDKNISLNEFSKAIFSAWRSGQIRSTCKLPSK